MKKLILSFLSVAVLAYGLMAHAAPTRTYDDETVTPYNHVGFYAKGGILGGNRLTINANQFAMDVDDVTFLQLAGGYDFGAIRLEASLSPFFGNDQFGDSTGGANIDVNAVLDLFATDHLRFALGVGPAFGFTDDASSIGLSTQTAIMYYFTDTFGIGLQGKGFIYGNNTSGGGGISAEFLF